MSRINPKQKRFVEEYLVDLNATQAAIRAGYSKKTARTQAADLLAKPNIHNAVARLQKKRSDKLEITVDKWLRELAIVGFSDLQHYIDICPDSGAIRAKAFKEMPDDASRALESIQEDRVVREDAKGEQSIINDKIKFKLHSKIEALKVIGQHLGFIGNKREIGELLDSLRFEFGANGGGVDE